jgi:uncharacterized repeat protein (TIGR03899 family)
MTKKSQNIFNNQADPTKNIVEAQSSPKKSQTNTKSVSSQMQLLTLAKQFVLDGGLIAAEKQMPLADRAKKRSRVSHLRKQQNLEEIIQKALGYSSENEVADRADQDWFDSFLVLAENVSNRTMQELWAKILAGEISQPGTFSLKALNIFKSMSIYDAKLLAKACTLTVRDQQRKNIRIISGCYQKPGILNFFNRDNQQHISLNIFGLSYADLLVLAENHLIFIQETESHPMNKKEEMLFNFDNKPLTFTPKKSNCILVFYKFTPMGNELANLINSHGSSDYLNTLKSQFSHHFAIKD